MKDHLRFLATQNPHRNFVREYLQARILGCLQQSGAMIPLAFHGGTALRFLYDLPRFSEDLDFALEAKPERYNMRKFLAFISKTLTSEGYSVEIKWNDNKVVHSAFVRFPGLLFDLTLSPHPSEVLSIKVEVDTNPPAGATLETSVIRKHIALNIQHHDLPSLFAGKLHALLQRPYQKGRDLYDLMWYLTHSDKLTPNLSMLNASLYQSGWKKGNMTGDNWRENILFHLKSIDWPTIRNDVAPFIENPGEVQLLNLDTFKRLLSGNTFANYGLAEG